MTPFNFHLDENGGGGFYPPSEKGRQNPLTCPPLRETLVGHEIYVMQMYYEYTQLPP